jgi:hypothetical protein
VRELGPFVLLVCACGAAARQPPRPTAAAGEHGIAETSAASPSAATAAAGSEDAAEVAAAFDSMAGRAASLAPGMHEVTRKDAGPEPVELVKADARDVCVRVAYEATAPVVAKLVDRGGSVLAAAEAAATEGVLGARGPVCVRRGEIVRGAADGAGARIRWMAWEAP